MEYVTKGNNKLLSSHNSQAFNATHIQICVYGLIHLSRHTMWHTSMSFFLPVRFHPKEICIHSTT